MGHEAMVELLRERLSLAGVECPHSMTSAQLVDRFGPHHLANALLDANDEIYKLRKTLLVAVATLEVFYEVGTQEEIDAVELVLNRLTEILGQP